MKSLISACIIACAVLPAAAAPGTKTTASRKDVSASTKALSGVSARPFQFRQSEKGGYLVIDVRNPGARPIVAALTTSVGSLKSSIPGKTVRRLELPASGRESRLDCAFHQGKAVIRTRLSLAGTPSTVIPFGEREAPIYDQLWALKPEWKMVSARHIVGIKPWTPKDLHAKAQFQYDEAGLWMRFIIIDDVFHQTRTGLDIWREDSVKVSIQADAITRHAFGFAMTPEGPKTVRYRGPGGVNGTIDVRQRGTETTYDIRVPWSDLEPLRAEAGLRFRMNFMVNENDGAGRRGWLEWTPGIGAADVPAQWMEWTLGKPEPLPDRM